MLTSVRYGRVPCLLHRGGGHTNNTKRAPTSPTSVGGKEASFNTGGRVVAEGDDNGNDDHKGGGGKRSLLSLSLGHHLLPPRAKPGDAAAGV
jgi:hypothetical protein